MARVLIVATNDDSQTCLTSYWAKSLQRCLASAGHETELLGGHDVTLTGLKNAIAGAQPRIEYVIFYGHGDPDRLYAQRTSPTTEQAPILVDELHADVLRGANLYTVACYALDKLGDAYAALYNPTHQFIGYKDLFAFSEYDIEGFEWLTRIGAFIFVDGRKADIVVDTLKTGWSRLRDFYLMPLQPHSPSEDLLQAPMCPSYCTSMQGVWGWPHGR